jgi:hypothetical protein
MKKAEKTTDNLIIVVDDDGITFVGFPTDTLLVIEFFFMFKVKRQRPKDRMLDLEPFEMFSQGIEDKGSFQLGIEHIGSKDLGDGLHTAQGCQVQALDHHLQFVLGLLSTQGGCVSAPISGRYPSPGVLRSPRTNWR